MTRAMRLGLMVAFAGAVMVGVTGCPTTFRGVDYEPITATDRGQLEDAVRRDGGDPSAGELGKAFRDARTAETATNPDFIIAVNRRLMDALEKNGNVGVVLVTTKNEGARVKARPAFDKSPEAVRESDLLTSEAKLSLPFGRWKVWTERVEVGRTSEEETVEVLDAGPKTRVILEKK